ncbi:MAG: translation elongation factor Ts [Candidatus Fermentibacteraceae bacterium]
MAVEAKRVKELRDMSGAGIMDCKKALEESGGDVEKALVLLREKGLKIAKKKAGREATEGRVEAYVHHDFKIGVLVQVNCETDFVAMNDNFREFCHELAMHIAASDPQVISREDLPEEQVTQEREILRKQLEDSGKPDHIKDKIVEGRMKKFFAEVCLLDQEWMHDADMGSVQQVLTDLIAKIGENIVISNFARYSVR